MPEPFAVLNPEPTVFQVLKRRWPLPVAGMLLGAAIGFATTYLARPVYRTRAEIVVTPSAGDSPILSGIISATTVTPLTTLNGLMTSRAVRQYVAEKAGIPEQDVPRQFFIQSDPITSQIVLFFDAENASKGREVLGQVIEQVRSVQLDASTTTASQRAKQLRQVLNDAQLEYRQAQDEFSALLQTVSTVKVKDGEPDPIGDQQRLSELQSNLKQVEEGLRLAKTQRESLLREPDLPKSETSEAGEYAYLEGLRQTLESAETALAALRKTQQDASPAVRDAVARRDAAKTLYENERSKALARFRKGLDEEVARLTARRDVLAWRLGAQLALVREAPGETSRVLSEVQRLDRLQGHLADLRGKFEVARIEAEVERMTWTVLTPPVTEERPINKRYARTPAASGVLGLGIGALLALMVGGRKSN